MAVLWMAFIFMLSSLPGSAIPGSYGSLGHFGLYAILGALLLLALPERLRPWTACAIAVLIASAYGVSDEFHQSFTPGRTPDPMDWLVDTAGALTTAWAITLVRLRARSR